MIQPKFERILEELKMTLSEVSEEQVAGMVERIVKAPHIYFAGVGRSGNLIRTLESVLDVLSFSLESSGVFMPSCPHCMYNRLIINDLYDNSKNICFHLYSHALTMF